MLTFHTSAPLFKSSDVSIDTALSYQLVTSEVPEEFDTAVEYRETIGTAQLNLNWSWCLT